MNLLLVIFTLKQFCGAMKSFNGFDVTIKNRRRSHWEPKYGKSNKFESVESKWIKRKLDNFDPQNQRTRYLENRTNVIYGGKKLNVRNVYSTHGQFDPWRPAEV